MRVDAANRKIFLKPQLPAGINFVERKKRVGKSWALVTVKRKGKKVMAKSSNKKIRVFLEKG
jgi:hypothetical protein